MGAPVQTSGCAGAGSWRRTRAWRPARRPATPFHEGGSHGTRSAGASNPGLCIQAGSLPLEPAVRLLQLPGPWLASDIPVGLVQRREWSGPPEDYDNGAFGASARSSGAPLFGKRPRFDHPGPHGGPPMRDFDRTMSSGPVFPPRRSPPHSPARRASGRHHQHVAQC